MGGVGLASVFATQDSLDQTAQVGSHALPHR